LRSVFECIRRGQKDMAEELCRVISHPWRAASLRGSLFYRNPRLGERGRAGHPADVARARMAD
jgi:hypothetical protein